ncbi:MAG: hypothetical protein PHH47_10965 [Gallionella sp.]|nr:hypothetical protein [Gallionella sp.]MDD4946538.1 hypothetical protein [Gallionella sp.]MDD5612871.1 hypothetical protein [Gallionella sp.]
MKTQVSQESDDAIFTLMLQNDEMDRIFWFQDKSSGEVKFEAEGHHVGRDAIVKECTVMRDGVHIVLSSGEVVSFYFCDLSLREYLGVVSALKKLYPSAQKILEVFDA